MELENLINKRCLIKNGERWGNKEISEVKILELSPSKNFVRLMNEHGQKYWKSVTEIQLIEVLKDLSGRPLD